MERLRLHQMQLEQLEQSLQTEQFLQTVSVTPDGKNSENNVPWENEQEHQGGTITIGDDSNTAPAKKNNIWSDGEE